VIANLRRPRQTKWSGVERTPAVRPVFCRTSQIVRCGFTIRRGAKAWKRLPGDYHRSSLRPPRGKGIPTRREIISSVPCAGWSLLPLPLSRAKPTYVPARRSSLATMTGPFAFRAALIAAASFDLRFGRPRPCRSRPRRTRRLAALSAAGALPQSVTRRIGTPSNY
jgi:hypothetical protein